MGHAFASRWIIGNLAHFALWMPLLVSVPVALAGAALPWLARKRVPLLTTLILGTWFGGFVILYAPYFCAGENWGYVRFFFRLFPP